MGCLEQTRPNSSARRDARELGSSWTAYQRHDFTNPAADLAPYVDHYWVVSWTYAQPYRQLIVPYPNVHLTFQNGGATVNGVSSGHQIKVLDGDSSVFGVAFRPGCFWPYLRTSVSTITDRSVPVTALFGAMAPPEPVEVATVERFLRALLQPEPDPRAHEAADIVAVIASSPEITRVADLARTLGVTVRQLQRLFAEYVGIGPKWVIRRYRLHEVTERLAAGETIEWASLAAELGYADQPHFVRDFVRMFGESPTWYAERF